MSINESNTTKPKFADMSLAELATLIDRLDAEASKGVKMSKALTHRQSVVHRLCICGDGSGMIERLDENNVKQTLGGFNTFEELEPILQRLINS